MLGTAFLTTPRGQGNWGTSIKIAHTILSAQGDRRVQFFQRDDASFGFEAHFWLPEEQIWIHDEWYSYCRLSSLDEAISEALNRVLWILNDVT